MPKFWIAILIGFLQMTGGAAQAEDSAEALDAATGLCLLALDRGPASIEGLAPMNGFVSMPTPNGGIVWTHESDFGRIVVVPAPSCIVVVDARNAEQSAGIIDAWIGTRNFEPTVLGHADRYFEEADNSYRYRTDANGTAALIIGKL